jgi:phage FluMu protein Com
VRTATVSCPLCNRVLIELKTAAKANVEIKCDECGAWFNVVVVGPEKEKQPKPEANIGYPEGEDSRGNRPPMHRHMSHKQGARP